MKTLVISFLLLLNCIVPAKAKKDNSIATNWSAGYTLGASSFLYTIDISENSTINHFDENYKFSFGFNVDYKLSEVITFQGEWVNGKLSGISSEGNPLFPNTVKYRTNLNQLSLNGLFNFNNLFAKKKNERNWFVYGKAGAGIVFLDGKLDRTIQDKTSFAIPVGAGVRYNISKNFSIGIETSATLGNDWFNAHKESNTNSDFLESYHNTGIKLTYRFNKKQEEPLVDEGTKDELNEQLPVIIPNEVIEPADTSNLAQEVDIVKTDEVIEIPDQTTVTEKEKSPSQNYQFGIIEETAPGNLVVLPEIDENQLQILEEVRTSRTIVAKKGWKIKDGVVFGELPIEGVEYMVQVLATTKQMHTGLKNNYENDLQIKGPFMEYGGDHKGKHLYKYALDKRFSTFKEAYNYSKAINKNGKYKDSFVIAFKDGKQIK